MYFPPPTLTSCTPERGPLDGGTAVVLGGSGFLDDQAGAPTVSFAGVPASDLVVVDDSTISATSPPGAGEGAVDLTIRTNNGAATIVAGFEYYTATSWAVGAGGVDYEYANDVSTMADGAMIVVGGFNATATFGSGQAQETDLTSADGEDMFLARYETGGQLAWARRAGGSQGDWVHRVDTFPDGSFVIAGHFRGTATFGPGEANETTLTAVGDSDGVLARYAADGALTWVRQLGSPGLVYGHAVATLADGALLFTGSFYAPVTFGDGEPTETTLTPTTADKSDVFLARYEADGDLAWVVQAAGPEYDAVAGVVAFADGTCALTGSFSTAITLGPGEAGQTTLTSVGLMDTFVAGYASDGTLAWAKQVGGVDNDYPNGIDGYPGGEIVVCGAFEETCVFGPGEDEETTLVAGADGRDGFVARFGSSGLLAWARRADGLDPFDAAVDVAAANDGACVVTGKFGEAITFGEGDAAITLTPGGRVDIFLARYDVAGDIVWAEQAGGVDDPADASYPYGLDAFAEGSCVLVGEFNGTIIFGRDGPVETTLMPAGDADVFVAQFLKDGWR